MRNPVIILGYGGHASVLVDILKLLDVEILGYVTSGINTSSKLINIRSLGHENIIFRYKFSEVDLINGIGSTPEGSNRRSVTTKFKKQNYRFLSLIHPTATIGSNIVLSEGVQIMAGCIIQNNTTIGSNTIINTNSIVEHDCKIGDDCHVAPGATICGNVTILDKTFIGAHSCVINKIKIGSNVVVAAGSCIYKNIESDIKVTQKR